MDWRIIRNRPKRSSPEVGLVREIGVYRTLSQFRKAVSPFCAAGEAAVTGYFIKKRDLFMYLARTSRCPNAWPWLVHCCGEGFLVDGIT